MIKHPLSFALVAATAALAGCPAAQAQEAATCRFTLEGANVFTGAGFEQRDVSVNGAMFVADHPEGAPRIPASWMYVMPPIVDVHTHTLDQVSKPGNSAHRDFLDRGIYFALNPNSILLEDGALPLAPDQVEVAFTGGGITGPGGHPRPLYEGLVRAGIYRDIAIEELPGRAYHEAATPEEAREAVRQVAATGVKAVKMMLYDHTSPGTDSLDEARFRAAVDEAKTLGLRPMIHVEYAHDARLAFELGVAAIVHMPGHSGPRRGKEELYRLTPQDAALAAKNNVAVVPTLAIAFNSASGDALLQAQELQAYNLKLLREAGVTIGAGSDRYSADALDELDLMRVSGIFDGPELLRIATENGFRIAFGEDRKGGKIAPGYEASFIALYSDPGRDWYSLRNPIAGIRGGVPIETGRVLIEACAAD
ncbi:amidohydrolase family protein [Erythrobacter sp. JK5]|uniref:amidohydrolase family protein n=1 Tax=Erythrobacter sp. JK5 TaxID=2829500 RepID=UPI001BA5D67D|nr:amidohydrolase family protein [Erythrobacter sp. JK5]QUL37057.1 amidohydrolase family protein [Erythrobacter sp. JK5]